MRIDNKAKMFVGLKIDSKMREALAQATPGDRHYFDDPNSGFLRILPLGDEQWIGKLLEGGFAPTEMEDIQRNVISILNRVAPGARHSPSAMRIFVVDDTPGIVNTPPAPRGPVLNDY
jgi:hypothetical protein